MAHPLDATVVEIDVRDFDIRGKVFGLDGEAAVLRRDLDLAGVQVFDRLVAAAVPEAKLVCGRAKRATEQLMPEADAEDGDARAYELANLLDDRVHRGRVARPVRQVNPVRS